MLWHKLEYFEEFMNVNTKESELYKFTSTPQNVFMILPENLLENSETIPKRAIFPPNISGVFAVRDLLQESS